MCRQGEIKVGGKRGEDDHTLQHRKIGADAGTPTRAEGNVGEPMRLARASIDEAIRIEAVRLAPKFGVAVCDVWRDGDAASFGNVEATECVECLGSPLESVDGGVKAHRLLKD